jgi:aerobic carbon-monoxide dehydrogenase medium subunit
MPPLAVHRSRSQIPDFKLLRPRDLAEARAMLVADAATVPFAGGIDLVNRMKEGAAPATLMMLSGIAGLDTVRYAATDHAIEIGAMARHDDVATSAMVRANLPDLAACWDRIANIRIRMQGTVAGNLLAGMPGYEGPVLLSALGASLSYWRKASLGVAAVSELHGPDGSARFSGLVTGVRVPLPAPGVTRHLVYDRSLRPALSVALQLDRADDVAISARAVLGGCHEWPVTRELTMQGAALSKVIGSADDIAQHAFEDLAPMTVPWFGSLHYRKRVAPVVLARLLRGVAR